MPSALPRFTLWSSVSPLLPATTSPNPATPWSFPRNSLSRSAAPRSANACPNASSPHPSNLPLFSLDLISCEQHTHLRSRFFSCEEPSIVVLFLLLVSDTDCIGTGRDTRPSRASAARQWEASGRSRR